MAARIAARTARGLDDFDTDELGFALRTEGAPHAWPTAWTFAEPSGHESEVKERAERWFGTLRPIGERRCGVARSTGPDGRRVVAVVVVGALADLAPLPTRARLGQWLRFEATLLVEATHAHVVVLPPTGMPRDVPTTLHGSTAEAVFSADREGAWLVQLVGAIDGGPRPLLEAAVYVGGATPIAPGERAAPGEEAGASAPDDVASLVRMVNAARRTESVSPLEISAELTAAADLHARSMRDARVLAHDVGDGGPLDRLRRAGIEPSRPGENVAHARSLARAHRVLWASPSHRENILDPNFSKLGVGVARGADGSVWVCEVFADSGTAGIEHPNQAY